MAIRVNGTEISDQEIDERMVYYRKKSSFYDPLVRFQNEVGELPDAELRAYVENEKIGDALFMEYAMKTQPAPKPQHVAIEIANFPEFYEKLGADERMRRADQSLRETRARKALMKARNVTCVSEEACLAFYNEHLDFFRSENYRMTFCISVGFENEAFEGDTIGDVTLRLLQVREEMVKQGPVRVWDFTSFASRYSDSYELDQGFFGMFIRGQLPKPLEDVIFSLKEGEVSEPYRMDSVGALFLFFTYVPDSPHIEYSIMRDKIIMMLNDLERGKVYKSFCRELMAKAEIVRDPA
ncbi:MAG: peptidylprolyl isomerase [Kiritimatiellae bacterium]|nr:peptidylprolyl isomerase [Kiritimatiellia bacterium]MBP5226885.1 peptidylprolyl isomerase [Kiritimatiellia bacterium]